jgi:hypothetical protein
MGDRIWYRLDVSPRGSARASVRATSTCTVPLPAGSTRFSHLDAQVETNQPSDGTEGSAKITPAGRAPTFSFDWPQAAAKIESADGEWQVRIPALHGPAEVEVVLPPGAEFRCATGSTEPCGVWYESAPDERRLVRIVIPPDRETGPGLHVDYTLPD